jgi:hypothetical protein
MTTDVSYVGAMAQAKKSRGEMLKSIRIESSSHCITYIGQDVAIIVDPIDFSNVDVCLRALNKLINFRFGYL